MLRNLIRKLGFEITRRNHPAIRFRSDYYLRHNARRLEHLASLRLPVAGCTVLEVGAGIGDHSHYYADRGCKLTITEARLENLGLLKKQFRKHDVQYLNLEDPSPLTNSPFDIVHCFGILYHLKTPGQALDFLSSQCKKMLFLETCVSFGNLKEIHLVSEDRNNPTQSFSGTGSRPARVWVYEQLKNLFEYVYIPKTQPNHEEFPTDWTDPESYQNRLSRAVFICSREEINNDLLTQSLISHQIRHD